MLSLTSLVVAASMSAAPQRDAVAPMPISKMVHERWTSKDGAPTDILALAQTKDGYLWIGALSGLVRFDGVRFVPFATRGTDSLPQGGVARLLASRDSSLWIVWRSGMVSRERDGKLTTYQTKDGLPFVLQLAESSTGALIAGTKNGLFRFVDGKWVNANRDWQYEPVQTQTVWFDREGSLWAQTPNRVLYLPREAKQFVDPGMRLTRVAVQTDFAEAKDGNVWMTETYRSAHTVPRAGDHRPPSEVIVGSWAMLVDRKGTLWIGTGGAGIRRISDPTRIGARRIEVTAPEVEGFAAKDGLASDQVYALLEDRDGGVWVGTSRGLERFHEGAFTPYETPGLVRPRYLYATRDSTVWTWASNQLHFVRFHPGAIDTLTDPPYTPWNLFQAASGAIWTSIGYAIGHYEGRRLTQLPLHVNTAWYLSDIAVDSAGTVFVYDENSGLLRLAGDTLLQVRKETLRHKVLATLFLDRRGRLWICSERTTVYENGQLREFANDEAPPDIRGFRDDSANNLFAFGLGGISKLEGRRFRALSLRQGVLGHPVYAMAQDDGGGWWLTTQSGVVDVAPGEVDRAFADSTYVPRYRLFDASDGLPGTATKTARSLTPAADGAVWVGTDSGVARTDPRHLPPAPSDPVMIEAVRVDGKEFSPADLPAIQSRNRDLEIDFTSTEFSSPQRVQFRYQLEGAEPTWHDVGTRRRAYFTNLTPGTYHFRVASGNGDGVWNQQSAVWSFRVLPAWYQTLSFRGAAILLIGGLFAAIAVLFQRRRHVAAQAALRVQYEAALGERARIAQDLHDTLLQGFIGVTLQLKAAENALPAKPLVAAQTLARVQQLARDSLREARERVWDMRDSELGSTDIAAALESLANERTVDTGIDVLLIIGGARRRLPRQVENAAFRIGREVIANAVRHAAPHRIEIEAMFGETVFALEVRDDGRGFTPEQAEDARHQGHFGLTGVRERATRMGGTCDVRAREGGGTVVALKLPIEQREQAAQ